MIRKTGRLFGFGLNIDPNLFNKFTKTDVWTKMLSNPFHTHSSGLHLYTESSMTQQVACYPLKWIHQNVAYQSKRLLQSNIIIFALKQCPQDNNALLVLVQKSKMIKTYLTTTLLSPDFLTRRIKIKILIVYSLRLTFIARHTYELFATSQRCTYAQRSISRYVKSHKEALFLVTDT